MLLMKWDLHLEMIIMNLNIHAILIRKKINYILVLNYLVVEI